MNAQDFVYPNLKAVEHLCSSVDQSLDTALRYLSDLVTEVCPPAAERVARLQARLDAGGFPRWVLHAAQTLLLEAAESGDPAGVDAALTELDGVMDAYAPDRFELVFSDHPSARRFPLYRRVVTTDLKATRKGAYSFELSAPCEKTSEAFVRAVSALEAVDPELAREAACLVQEAFVIDTRRFRAGTTVGTLGAIFVSPLGARQDWKRFFEHFVHEAGHSLLFLLMTQAELLTDVEDTTLYESPYRSDKRPLGGVLHAYFVLWRTIYAFDKLLAHPEFRSEEATICTGYNQAGNTGRFMDRFWRTSAELDRSPSFTPFGRALVQSCRDGVSKIQQGGLRI